MARVLRTFPSFTREEVLMRMPWNELLAWYAWAVENDPDLMVERKTAGYVAQHIEAKAKQK